MNAPQIETKVAAKTSTSTEQNVAVYVTAIDSEVDAGWWIYGYRVKGRNSGRRQSMVPRLYFVPKN